MRKELPALVEFALHLVTHVKGELGLHPKAQDGLQMALDSLFASSARDPIVELEELLRMAWTLEAKGAFAVADGIVDAIAGDGRALAALRIASPMLRETKVKMAAFEDAAPCTAPEHDAAAPRGSVKLRSLLSPGRDLGRIHVLRSLEIRGRRAR
jgi:hypothetical protein